MEFEELWALNTPIQWQLEGRKELNKIIKKYNKWLLKGSKESKKEKLLRQIEYGKQTIGSTTGGSGYLEVLERMESNIK